MAIEQKNASEVQNNTHDKAVKQTVKARYLEAKGAKDFDHNQFCGLILAEHIEAAKASIDRIGKLWSKDEPKFPKSEKAWDQVQNDLYEHIENMIAQLKAGSTKVVKDLQPVEF